MYFCEEPRSKPPFCGSGIPRRIQCHPPQTVTDNRQPPRNTGIHLNPSPQRFLSGQSVLTRCYGDMLKEKIKLNTTIVLTWTGIRSVRRRKPSAEPTWRQINESRSYWTSRSRRAEDCTKETPDNAIYLINYTVGAAVKTPHPAAASKRSGPHTQKNGSE